MEVALVIAGAVLGVIVDYSFKAIRRYWVTTRPAGRLWGWAKQDDSELWIILSTCPNDDPSEYTDTIYPQEARAATELESYLKGALGAEVRLRLSVRANEAINSNLVLLGGPIHNHITRRVLPALNAPFQFDDHTLVNTQDGQRWSPSINDAGGRERIAEDYALIVKTRNPFDRRKTVLVVAGCRTHGVLAGARALIRERVTDTLAITTGLGDHYAMVIHAPVHEDVLGAPEIVASWPLDGPRGG